MTSLAGRLAATATLLVFIRLPSFIDVKTEIRTSMTIAGAAGGALTGILNTLPEGSVATAALKTGRLALRTDRGMSQFVDATNQKVYRFRSSEKDFTERTFSEERLEFRRLRDRWADLRMNSGLAQLFGTTSTSLPSQSRKRADRFEFVVETRTSNESTSVAGLEAKQIRLTLVAHEQNVPIEKVGGWIVTADLSLAPHIAALDELTRFRRTYFHSISDFSFVGFDERGAAYMDGMFPEFMLVATRLSDEIDKLDGTVISSSLRYEIVPTEGEQRRAASEQQRLGSSMRVLGGQSDRVVIAAVDQVHLSIQSSVTDDDVTMPTGYKLVKNFSAPSGGFPR